MGDLVLHFNKKWIVKKEDGTKYMFGDNQNESIYHSLQYAVKWGNWIGPSGKCIRSSMNSEGQEKQICAWNLSYIENIYGNRISYSYLNDEMPVGAIYPGDKYEPPYNPNEVGELHTEASYIEKITNYNGKNVMFYYGLKKFDGDFQEINEESFEPDAYQEHQERRFLDSIKILNNEEKILSFHFSYLFINDYENHYKKRLLSSIEQKNDINKSLPKADL